MAELFANFSVIRGGGASKENENNFIRRTLIKMFVLQQQ